MIIDFHCILFYGAPDLQIYKENNVPLSAYRYINTTTTQAGIKQVLTFSNCRGFLKPVFGSIEKKVKKSSRTPEPRTRYND